MTNINLKANIIAFIAILVLIVLIIIFFPLIAIWSLNTLFNLMIPYTIETWTASLFLSLLLTSSGAKYKK